MTRKSAKNISGFSFDLCEVDSDVALELGSTQGLGHVVYLEIHSLSDQDRRFEVSQVTYVTRHKEQLDKDGWYRGYPSSGTLKAGAHTKSGFFFWKKRLDSIGNGDRLYVEIVLPDEHMRVQLEFAYTLTSGRSEGDWELSNHVAEEVKVKPTPEQLSEVLTRGIERLDVFEERAGVTLENFYVSVSWNYELVTITGEVHASNGPALNRNVEVVVAMYDDQGRLIGTTSQKFYKEDFFAFDVFHRNFSSEAFGLKVHKIRVFPKIA